MVSHLIPASLTIPTPLLLGRNSSVVARSHSRRKGFNGDFWENPCHDEKRGKIPKQCREAFLTTLRLKWKYSPRFSHLFQCMDNSIFQSKSCCLNNLFCNLLRMLYALVIEHLFLLPVKKFKAKLYRISYF